MGKSSAGTISVYALMAAMLAAGSQIGVTAIAKAETAKPKTCTVAGIELYRDPVFVSSLHPSQRDGSVREVACTVDATETLTVGDTGIRLTLGRLFNGKVGDPVLNVRLVAIERIDSSGTREVGRVFLSPDPLTGEILFEPQATAAGESILIRLSRRHRWLFRMEGNTLSADTAFKWRQGLDQAFPDGAADGANLDIDLERMEGRIAVRARGNVPGGPLASTYGENLVVVAKLAWRAGALVAEGTETTLRKKGEEPFLDQVAQQDEKVRQDAKFLPPGTEPCSLGAWSNDPDPKGLNVRAEPKANARVLGIVPSARLLPPEQDETGSGPLKSEFRIVGYRDGWFLIDKIEAPGVKYGTPYPRALPQPYQGRGWVSSRMVGAAYAHSGLPEGNLFLSPHADAASSEIVDKNGNRLGPDGSPARIYACSGWWALVQTNEGQQGWWRALCSNQVTNCS